MKKRERDYESLQIRLYGENQKNAAKIIEDRKSENWLRENSYGVNDNEYLIIMYRYLFHADGWYAIVTTYYDDEIGPFKSEVEAKNAVVKYDKDGWSVRFVHYGPVETATNKFDILMERVI